MCIDWTMALQVLHQHQNTFHTASSGTTPMNETVDMTKVFGLTMTKAIPVKVHLKPRLPPQLHQPNLIIMMDGVQLEYQVKDRINWKIHMNLQDKKETKIDRVISDINIK